MEINMIEYPFRYVSVGASQTGVGYVFIELQRESAEPFGVVLSVEDAQKLVDDLHEQIQTANKQAR